MTAPLVVRVLQHKVDCPTYSLEVNGRLVIRHESFTICDAIRDYLTGARDWDTSECCEVAESIRARVVA